MIGLAGVCCLALSVSLGLSQEISCEGDLVPSSAFIHYVEREFQENYHSKLYRKGVCERNIQALLRRLHDGLGPQRFFSAGFKVLIFLPPNILTEGLGDHQKILLNHMRYPEWAIEGVNAHVVLEFKNRIYDLDYGSPESVSAELYFQKVLNRGPRQQTSLANGARRFFGRDIEIVTLPLEEYLQSKLTKEDLYRWIQNSP